MKTITTYQEPEGFKGTKGELHIVNDKIEVRPDNPLHTETLFRSFGDPKSLETYSNLLLCSQSKEMAKALQDVLHYDMAEWMKYNYDQIESFRENEAVMQRDKANDIKARYNRIKQILSAAIPPQ